MIREGEALMKNGDAWLHFRRPFEIVTAIRHVDVPQALARVENVVNTQGWHAAGFVSYEAAPAFDQALHVRGGADTPLLWFGLYPEPEEYDLPALSTPPASINWQPTIDRESYMAAIGEIKEYIARGMTYQVNYTMRLSSECTVPPFEFFLHIAQTQNKYAAYIDTGRFVICSASPELFFQLDDRTILSRPMKGTAKRGRTQQEDRVQSGWLQASIKNRAENVMIVDMIRNDLGRIAEIGSVKVPQLFSIEKYPTLLQMTSLVQARTSASIMEIFRALFPCASITGAPKVSTMKIIADLETTPRGIYTGSIGMIGPHRRAQFNVAIRTAVIDRERNTAEYGVGGGIVWDSTSADEFDEALLKSRVLTDSPPRFSLLETLLWTPQEGYFLLERHLQRISESAEYFDFSINQQAIRRHLRELAADFNSPMRVRLLSDRQGKFTCDVREEPPHISEYSVRLATQPLDSSDVFLHHKTTHRAVYDAARHENRHFDDVLLFNQFGELTELTIGNLVVELDGELLTPPVSCGLLAGTFRAHLLETGQLRERLIRVDELDRCGKLYMVNSLRKWVEIRLTKEIPTPVMN